MWWDELFTVALAGQPLGTVLAFILGPEAHIAAYQLLMHFWLALVGPTSSEVLVRLPSVIFGAAGDLTRLLRFDAGV